MIFTFLLELTKRWHLLALLLMRLFSNQVNKDFVAFSSGTIKLSISIAEAYGVSSSTNLAMSMLFRVKNKSARKMLN